MQNKHLFAEFAGFCSLNTEMIQMLKNCMTKKIQMTHKEVIICMKVLICPTVVLLLEWHSVTYQHKVWLKSERKENLNQHNTIINYQPWALRLLGWMANWLSQSITSINQIPWLKTLSIKRAAWNLKEHIGKTTSNLIQEKIQQSYHPSSPC